MLGILRAWAALIIALTISVAAQAAESCPSIPPGPALSLPHLRSALARGEQAVIVALGSSSTEGVMASDPGHSYPAELQEILSLALPHRHVAVINRGIGGQDARREFARLEADVIAIRPQLAIWQVGANAALRSDDPAEFRRLIAEGVAKLQNAGIDVVMMDNQRSPKILASSLGLTFDRTLAEVARQAGVGMFSRDQLMLSWEHAGVAPAMFLASDGLHHNDLGYRCVAEALATEIAAAVTPPSLSASR